MSQITLFVQNQGDAGITEVVVAQGATESDLYGTIVGARSQNDTELFIFVDESEAALSRAGSRPVEGLKPGARVHIARCQRIKTTVHFLEKTIEKAFPPGARVKTVKAWAAREFHLDHKDAAEHVLQICNSKDRPASDTPLHVLVRGEGCAVCFDLVPEKRVEG